ncbi:MAG TPA: hypothetical protein PLG59_16880 [bacterium]|nr:hypothetical protein [bacterium]
MRSKAVWITSVLVVFLLVWVGLGKIRTATNQEDAATNSPTPSSDGTLVTIGTLAGEPVLIDETMVARGVENIRKFYESQSKQQGPFKHLSLPDEEASRVTIVRGEIVDFAKKQLIAKYGLTVTPGEDSKAFNAMMRALSGETAQSVAEHLRHISDALKAMHFSGATFETAYETHCKSFGIKEEELRFYADSLKQHSDDPDSYIASIPTTDEQIKRQSLANGGFSRVVIEKQLAEKLLNRSIDESDFQSYLADLEREILTYLHDNLHIADSNYQGVLERIEQNMKAMRGELNDSPSSS